MNTMLRKGAFALALLGGAAILPVAASAGSIHESGDFGGSWNRIGPTDVGYRRHYRNYGYRNYGYRNYGYRSYGYAAPRYYAPYYAPRYSYYGPYRYGYYRPGISFGFGAF